MSASMKTSTRSLLPVLGLVTLAGCAGAVTVTGQRNISASYEPSELYVVATGSNQLRTVIVGNPFGQPQAEFDAAVLAALEGRNIGPTLNLSTNPTQEDPRQRRVVLAFNLSRGADGDDLCARTDEVPIDPPSADTLSVTGAYCADELPLTQATARTGQVTTADSAQFRSLMSQLALALFPPNNRRDKRGRD